MPYSRKGTRYWWISYSTAEGPQQQSSGTTSWREADRLEKKLRGKKVVRPVNESVCDVLETYLAFIEGEDKYERSLACAKPITSFFGERSVYSLLTSDIKKYSKWRKRAVATMSKELQLLSKSIDHWNAENKLTDDALPNPLRGYIPSAKEHLPIYLTEDQYHDFLNNIDPKAEGHLKDIIILAVNTGMRPGELLGLTWDRIDLRNKLILFNPDDQKNKSAGAVPLNDEAYRVIRDRRFKTKTYLFEYLGKRIGSVKRSFNTALRNAGIPIVKGSSPKMLRHTCATWMVQHGVHLKKVAKVLRHKNITTTEIYTHLTDEDAREAVNALSLKLSR